MHKSVSNPDGRVIPSIRGDSVPAPACSPGTPVPSKHMRESLNLSPVTPKRNDNLCRQKGKRKNVKMNGRFTRSMSAKVSTVKPSVNKNIDIETVLIDDEEGNLVLSSDGLDIDHEPVMNHTDNSSPVSDKNR